MTLIKSFKLWRLRRRIRYLEDRALMLQLEQNHINTKLLPALRKRRNTLVLPPSGGWR